ncbi:MAG: type IX secretion system protein PorD [Bacteroidia bacterium]
MKKISAILLLLTVFCSLPTANCQELNPQVQVTSVSTQQMGSDIQRICATLQQQIFNFLSTRRWTNDNFQQNERIDCSILLNLTSRPATDQFTGEMQIQCRRPVFKTGYNTPLFNFDDKEIQINYVENQPFDFNIQNFTSNITSLLAYYAYVILAEDYDSFSPLGGTEYWKNAQQIVNNAQSASESGWHSSDNSFRNRYTLIDNILNPTFQPMRETMYNYHRKGLDQMYDKLEEGRAALLASIDNLKEVHKNRPASFNMQLFFEAKNQELISIFKDDPLNEEKTKIIDILNLIDPANQNLYSKITAQ